MFFKSFDLNLFSKKSALIVVSVFSFFIFSNVVSAASTPVATLYINGTRSNVTINQADSFSIQAIGTNSPTVCYVATYFPTTGVWSGWVSYSCADYQTPQTMSASGVGFSPGWNDT